VTKRKVGSATIPALAGQGKNAIEPGSFRLAFNEEQPHRPLQLMRALALCQSGNEQRNFVGRARGVIDHHEGRQVRLPRAPVWPGMALIEKAGIPRAAARLQDDLERQPAFAHTVLIPCSRSQFSRQPDLHGR
jgi:hypothetical protein